MANFNNGPYVEDAIRSVLQQTKTDWELIIVDDASTDDSVPRIERYLSDPRISLHRQSTNRGYTNALIFGLTRVSSQIVGILDSDDALMPEAVAKVCEAFAARPDIGLVLTQLYFCDSALRRLWPSTNTAGHLRDPLIFQRGVNAFRSFRLGAYNKTTGLDPALPSAEECDLVIRLEEVAPWVRIDEPLYLYRQLPQSQSRGSHRYHVSRSASALVYYRAFLRRRRTSLPNLARQDVLGWLVGAVRWSLAANDPGAALRFAFFALRIAPHSLSTYRALARSCARLVRGRLRPPAADESERRTFLAPRGFQSGCGRIAADGVRCVPFFHSSGHCLFGGDYVLDAAGAYRATFEVSALPFRTHETTFTIDVYENLRRHEVLAGQPVVRTLFPIANRPAELEFSGAEGDRLEFRVYWHGNSLLRVTGVWLERMESTGQPATGTAHAEAREQAVAVSSQFRTPHQPRQASAILSKAVRAAKALHGGTSVDADSADRCKASDASGVRDRASLPLNPLPLPTFAAVTEGLVLADDGKPEQRLTSKLCVQADFLRPSYVAWIRRLRQAPRFHRKQWEFWYILQALHERGALQRGKKGIGFGVGTEPLPSLLASLGVEVVATDQELASAVSGGWTVTRQHANALESLVYPDICAPDTFGEHVRFEHVDMNCIAEKFDGQFDFCWSSCCFEHLGSIEKGLRFVERSTELLKAGGVAVHTTEFNLSPNDETFESPALSLFRRKDLEILAERLTARGLTVEPLDLDAGRGYVDGYIDLPPYLAEPHLKLQLSNGYTCTSAGIIISRPPPTRRSSFAAAGTDPGRRQPLRRGRPDVSVIVPVYNKGTYVSDCLASVLGQEQVSLEVICVDDASTDSSSDVLHRWAEMDGRVQVVRHPSNRGAGESRNTGLAAATGRFVQFTDADDVLPPGSLARLLAAAERTGVEAVRGGIEIFAHGEPTPREGQTFDSERIGPLLDLPEVWVPWYLVCYLLSRPMLERHGIRFPDIWPGEDPVFLARALVSVDSICLIPEITYTYRLVGDRPQPDARAVRDYLAHAASVKLIYGDRYERCWMKYRDLLSKEIASLLQQSSTTVEERRHLAAELDRLCR